ncbi:MAG: hypothetical protein KKA55_13865 [Proteobacteria bacterium]|nr:hypothetical protein [Pseudomonadota bacterium]MBU1596607.1 hypothetical protein [Pseudomonadota bacterium]
MGSLREYRNLEIDWSMTPWDAVTLYLEWGNNSWHAQHQPVRSKSDFCNYFVVYTWDKTPRAILVRRNSEEALELAQLDLPEPLGEKFLESVGHLKGVYPPTEEVRQWLERELLSPN